MGQVWGRRGQKGRLRCSGHIRGRGGQSGWWRRRLSSPKRPCREAGMHEGTAGGTGRRGGHRSQSLSGDGGSRGHRRWESSGGGGGAALLRDGREDRLAPSPSKCVKGGREKAGAIEEQDDNVGTPLLLPQLTSTLCEETGDVWDRNTRWRGGQRDGRTDRHESVSIENPLRKSN